MAASPSDDPELLAAAGEESDDSISSSTPRCPRCGSALDDVATMTDMEVLKHMRTEMYRDLLRNLRTGAATHQEKAIARGILRDNKITAEDDDEDDDPETRKNIGGEEYTFEPGSMNETEGG